MVDYGCSRDVRTMFIDENEIGVVLYTFYEHSLIIDNLKFLAKTDSMVRTYML